MTDAERDTLEREISELLEPFSKLPNPETSVYVMESTGWQIHLDDGFNRRWFPKQWTRSEDASARLLEMMRRPLLVSDWPGCEGWRVDIGVDPSKPVKGWYGETAAYELLGPTHADRKVAIALAAKAWLERKDR